MLRKFLIGFALLISFTGCMKSEENNLNCTYDPCQVKAPASEIQEVQAYLTANNLTAQQHCSGIFYIINNPGTGATPNACSRVRVTYDGRLTNGNQFDARTTEFYLDQVIRGWVNGVPLIKQGGSIRLFIPPSMGYGSQSNGTIPANSILVFDITLDTVY